MINEAGESRRLPRMAITVDLHLWDHSQDISYSAEWLADAGIRATYFVMSQMFLHKPHVEHLKRVHELGHEVGSHSHMHDPTEMKALVRGDKTAVQFLRLSKKIFEDFYGESPVSFRSPCWCSLGPTALDALEELGYRVDSSCTPQRLSFTGSYPYEKSWFFSSRGVRFIRPKLLEIPSSSFLVPASSKAFRILRKQSFNFLKALLWEAQIRPNRVVTIELHPEDFNRDSQRVWTWNAVKPADFLLKRVGGLEFRHFLQDMNYDSIGRRTQALIKMLAERRTMTLSEIRATVAEEIRFRRIAQSRELIEPPGGA